MIAASKKFCSSPALLAALLAAAWLAIACSWSGVLPLGSTGTPTASPSPTEPPFTPTPTPSPTPVPTPTPIPAVRIASGDKALFNGDWDEALREYSAVQTSQPDDAEVQAAATLGMGRAYYLSGDYARALSSLRSLVDDYPDSAHRAAGYFFLGQTYNSLARYSEAADAYLNYMALRPGVIDAYILEMRGDSLYAEGRFAEALNDYNAALQSPRTGDRGQLQIKTARAYALTGDYATALVMYQDIYNRSTNEYAKAQLDLLMGQTYIAIGQTEKAYAAYLDAVENYPLAYDSYLALVALVDAGYPVNELDRGLVDYFAGQHNVAIAAFDRYLASGPDDPATAYYYKGLSLRALGSYQEAVEQWNMVINSYSASIHWDKAWKQKADTYWRNLEDRPAAIQVLLDFVGTASWHWRAAELLSEAAFYSEILGDLEQAAVLWERVANEYPASDYAYRSLFLSGITRYRQANYAAAVEIFKRCEEMAANISLKSAASLWTGKAYQALGDADAARSTWEATAAMDPTGYYSERARDLMFGRQPFQPPAVMDLGYDPEAEQAEAETWMRATFFLPAETNLSSLGPLLDDERLQRGQELWSLGLQRQARDEFESLRAFVEHDAVNTYRLANYLNDLGLYRSAILAARRVLTLAGMDDAATMNAPMHFNRIRFGAFYSELFIPAAETYNFHPFLLFSVARQESFFESFIGSAAGARGLMQFMPATGQERAERLNWPPNYTSDDLYRPLVSVAFGANYLDYTRSYLDGDLYAALAGYNGGPGNAREWKDLAGDDPDLFLEVVRFEETRRYIRAIYEMFSIYSRLYSRSP